MTGVIYQLTFFLALGLLAILVTIFVFAVSLLGRAIEVAAKEQEKAAEDQKEATEREIAAIQKQISRLRKKEHIGEELSQLEKQLKQLRKQDKKFANKLSKIGRAPELLTVKGGVVPAAGSLLGALILSGTAWYLSSVHNFVWIVSVLIWILGLVAIGYSIFRIYRCLRVIESVAIVSEETALRRTIEAFKIAQKELEEEKKPKLELEFEDGQPPFHVEAASEMFIKFTVGLSRGDVARNAAVAFWAPPGFEFPDSVKSLSSRDPKYAGYVSTRIDLRDVTKPISRVKSVKLKAPPKPNSYGAVYRLYCEGFYSDFEEFEIVVEELELEPEDIPL